VVLGHAQDASLEVPDEPAQLRAALAAEAAMELHDPPPPNGALIAFQAYLQACAPLDVVVPFAEAISAYLGRGHGEPRILRDFPRLLSLIKAVAVVRISQRQRDAEGRLIATVEDYAKVYVLVADAWQATGGPSAQIREAVNAVRELTAEVDGATVTVTQVAGKLGVSVPSATRRVREGVDGGWLVNEERRRSQKAKLRLGEPLPPTKVLPSPGDLAAATEADDSGLAGAGGSETPVDRANAKSTESRREQPVDNDFTISADPDVAAGSKDELTPPERSRQSPSADLPDDR